MLGATGFSAGAGDLYLGLVYRRLGSLLLERVVLRLAGFLAVSGITRNPHVYERMNVSVFDSLSLRQTSVGFGD